MMPLSLLVVLSMHATPAPKDPLPPALKELQGEWRAISVEEKGMAWNDKEEVAEFVLEIAGDVLIYKRDTPVEKFRITLDSTAKPASIDLRLIAKDACPSKACHGVYAIDGERLKLCLPTEFTANDAKERPEEFKTGGKRPPHGKLLIILERVKK